MQNETEIRITALRFMKEWSVWMVGVETALLGFLVSLLSRDMLALGSYYLKGAAICFGLSIAFAAWVLGAIPSISQRLSKETGSIYMLGLFKIPVFRHVRLGWITFLQHLFFLLGLGGLIGAVLEKQVG
jgi:hypothetical protein